ncbi:MAG TPA: ankyrin repeat domain-containing protein [Candidatus Binatia bacterium]|jgi:ankyrin repeat protein|nr:ankyrin repeat domain-containing protein [Candidatus Binatia bacterium]
MMSRAWFIAAAFLLFLPPTACKKGSDQAEARQALKRLGVPFSRDTFVEQVRSGDPLVVDLLLAAGIDPNDKDANGVTPLMRFVMEGNEDAVQRLLAKGADVNAKDNTGATALMAAAGYGHTTIVQILLDRGTKVNASGNEGDTALMQAALNGHPAIARLLLDHGAEVNAKTKSGRTALQYAEAKAVGILGRESSPEVVTLLKQAGARE